MVVITIGRTWRAAVGLIAVLVGGMALPAAALPAPEPLSVSEREGFLRNQRDGGALSGRGDAHASADGYRAQAASGCAFDAVGDSLPGAYPPADIVEHCAEYGSAHLRLAVKPAQQSNPLSDPSWMYGVTGTMHGIDVDGDGLVDYDVFLMNLGGALSVVVEDSVTLATACEGTGEHADGWFVAHVPVACLGSPAVATTDAFLAYDSQWDDPDAPVYADFAGAVTVTRPSAPSADPITSPGTRATQRLAGSSRFETAAAISRHAFPEGADTVYLARADSFADALAGGALGDGPILLVPSCGAVPELVKAEVRRLGATTVIALGGGAAVCDAVLAEVAAS